MSYASTVQRVQAEYSSTLVAGTVVPVPSVESSLNVITLFCWLLVCRRLSLAAYRRGRWLALIGVISSSLWSMLYCRSVGVVGSIGVGLNAGLCTILAVNFTLLHNPTTFRRLRLCRSDTDTTDQVHSNFQDPQEASTSQRRLDRFQLMWEPMPDHVGRRIFWILDLLTSLRGIHWSGSLSAHGTSKYSVELSRTTRKYSMARDISRFMLDYLLLDFIKCLMIADPYFLSLHPDLTQQDLAWHRTPRTAVYTYRMTVAAIGTCVAIDILFACAALLQVNILGTGLIGFNTLPVSLTPLWGSPRAIITKGLRGFWGETWHQIFRMHFTSISDALARCLIRRGALPVQMPHRSRSSEEVVRPVVRTTVAFLLSGALHACGSYTLLGPTRPWAPFLFFALQPVGLAVQHLSSCFIGRRFLTSDWGLLIRWYANSIFTLIWLWACAGLLFDDFSSGSVWLFEPVPVSPLRGLGYSKEDNRIWCWS